MPEQVVDIFLQLCQAVASMHSMVPALAHRDIKPQNVLLSHDSGAGGGSGPGTKYSVALTDFGSSAPAVVEVNSRSEALALQVLAE